VTVATASDTRTLTIEKLDDPVLDSHGQHVTSRYVEVFWLPVLGPTSLWLLRHCSFHTEHGPYTVDARTLGRSLGVGAGPGRHNPLIRSLDRLVSFHCGLRVFDRWALRTHLGPLPQRHLNRLPEALQEAHDLLAVEVAS
jgi:hypothetical protein